MDLFHNKFKQNFFIQITDFSRILSIFLKYRHFWYMRCAMIIFVNFLSYLIFFLNVSSQFVNLTKKKIYYALLFSLFLSVCVLFELLYNYLDWFIRFCLSILFAFYYFAAILFKIAFKHFNCPLVSSESRSSYSKFNCVG